MPRDRTQSDVDVLDKVFEAGTDAYDYVIETAHGTITYDMTRVSRVRRQEFLSALPEDLIEFMQQQENEKQDDLDVEELSDLDRVQDAEPDETPPMSVIGAAEVREFESLILDSLQHPKITENETRELMDRWSDEQFYATAFLIVAISAETSGVESFRTER
jgi:hypothetical protein